MITRTKKISSGLALITGLLALSACDRQDSAAPATRSEPSPASNPQGEAGIQAVLDAYERIRDLLAKDASDAASDAASDLERAANALAATAPEAQREAFGKLAAASAKLHETKKDGADAVRKAFGDVSEPLVGLLSADPSLRKGQYLFMCPMAEGYQKWVQRSDKISNPYMGTKMLECGSESAW